MTQDASAKSSKAPEIQPLPPAPTGYAWVYNRLNTPYTRMFDGSPIEFAPNQCLIQPEETARFLANHSMVKLDPTSGQVTMAVVREGDPNFRKSLDEDLGNELIDRSVNPSYYEGKKTELPTHVDVMVVPGGNRPPSRTT